MKETVLKPTKPVNPILEKLRAEKAAEKLAKKVAET